METEGKTTVKVLVIMLVMLAVLFTLICYSACVVAGRADEIDREIVKEWAEKNTDCAWGDPDE